MSISSRTPSLPEWMRDIRRRITALELSNPLASEWVSVPMRQVFQRIEVPWGIEMPVLETSLPSSSRRVFQLELSAEVPGDAVMTATVEVNGSRSPLLRFDSNSDASQVKRVSFTIPLAQAQNPLLVRVLVTRTVGPGLPKLVVPQGIKLTGLLSNAPEEGQWVVI